MSAAGSLPAVILVGGEGTRLRPLTASTPKPMLPLVDRPLLAYTFEHLARHGVDRAILSCGYLPTQIEAHFGNRYGPLGLSYRVEPTPLGTGGGIRFGAEGLSETFVALNGDVLHGADLGSMLAFHRERGAAGTILLAPVDDPSRYGLVRCADDGRVRAFVEKPRAEEIDTNLINAGLYVLEPEVLDLVDPDRPVSIERDVFPRLVEAGSLYGFRLDGYWRDIGTPASYLEAHWDVLERNFSSELGDSLGPDYTLVATDARVAAGARLDPTRPRRQGRRDRGGGARRQPRRRRRGRLDRRRSGDRLVGRRGRALASAREPRWPARSSASGQRSAAAAGSGALRSSGPAPGWARGICSRTASASPQGRQSLRRP